MTTAPTYANSTTTSHALMLFKKDCILFSELCKLSGFNSLKDSVFYNMIRFNVNNLKPY
ncbi:predicted protein [Histoplasma mississippiense (nom. inval.)]|uniref:predicted protein n=1 Tax=Ajellomyces capsulatus (strain NAm1 / WU24) TaxID=2059318 RepID=UPI000157D139|nr:predicted protein [Histoplasma mississippiense (nom. inval.)]EDN11296.1 predicted protein [Histoplasma mississippiense (nom. inval.)]